MKIENNILYGETVGSKTDLISADECANEYKYITSFTDESYMQKIELTENDLTKYKELLLILCKKSTDEILNTTYISEYDINVMINNYEFTDGSFKLEKLDNNEEYYIIISIKNKNMIYVTCDDKSKGYLFGKVIVEEEE